MSASASAVSGATAPPVALRRSTRKRSSETTEQEQRVATVAKRARVGKTESNTPELGALGQRKWELLEPVEGKFAGGGAGTVQSFARRTGAVDLRRCYHPGSEAPFAVSRSAIERYIKCPNCFYLQARDNIKPPPGYPLSINIAVDDLLKKEFDVYRELGVVHPKVAEAGLDLKPFQHDDMDIWRNNFKGVRCHYEPTNMTIFGAIDDVWINKKGELVIVDYKATSKKDAVSLDAQWQDGYKRQMEIYQWIMRQMGFKVSDTTYFVYCNGDKKMPRFDGKVEFDISLIPFVGDDSWIAETLAEIKDVLDESEGPESSDCCDLCNYVNDRAELDAATIVDDSFIDDE